jgi:hypothetical protein
LKIEFKSLFIGIAIGVVGVFSILFLFGNVETELSFKTGDIAKNKNIEVWIEQTIKDGEDLTNIVLKGRGDVTRNELDQELERILEEQGIDRKTTNITIKMEIDS